MQALQLMNAPNGDAAKTSAASAGSSSSAGNGTDHSTFDRMLNEASQSSKNDANQPNSQNATSTSPSDSSSSKDVTPRDSQASSNKSDFKHDGHRKSIVDPNDLGSKALALPVGTTSTEEGPIVGIAVINEPQPSPVPDIVPEVTSTAPAPTAGVVADQVAPNQIIATDPSALLGVVSQEPIAPSLKLDPTESNSTAGAGIVSNGESKDATVVTEALSDESSSNNESVDADQPTPEAQLRALMMALLSSTFDPASKSATDGEDKAPDLSKSSVQSVKPQATVSTQASLNPLVVTPQADAVVAPQHTASFQTDTQPSGELTGQTDSQDSPTQPATTASAQTTARAATEAAVSESVAKTADSHEQANLQHLEKQADVKLQARLDAATPAAPNVATPNAVVNAAVAQVASENAPIPSDGKPTGVTAVATKGAATDKPGPASDTDLESTQKVTGEGSESTAVIAKGTKDQAQGQNSGEQSKKSSGTGSNPSVKEAPLMTAADTSTSPVDATAKADSKVAVTETTQVKPTDSRIDRANLVKQVTDHAELMAASRPRDGVVVHLEPKDLGTIMMTIKNAASSVTTEIAASDEHVRTALEQSRPELMSAMHQRGMNVQSITVTTASASTGSATTGAFAQQQDGQSTRQQAQHSQQMQNLRTVRQSGAIDVPTSVIASQNIRRAATGVDVWI